jgi:hypothetical protein
MEEQSNDLGIVLAVAVPCLLLVLPAAWKAASLRGDIFNKWSERVDLAHAGLHDRAITELLGLQDDISEALGGATGFTPAEVWIDPDPLVRRANQCAELLHARDKLHGRFLRHRQLGPVLIPGVVAYVVGWLAATLYFTDVIKGLWAMVLGFVLGGLAIVTGVVVFGLYAYFESKLTAAEEMAAGKRG